MMMQSKEKETIIINIDKINGITNGLCESFNGIVKSFNEVTKKNSELIESFNGSFEIYRESIKCKKDTAISIYTDDTLEGMRKLHGFNIKLWNEKDNTDFFDFVVWGVVADCIDNEDERVNLPLYDFILSITGWEVQHKSVEYYNKLREALIQTDAKQLSAPPAPKAVGNNKKVKTAPTFVVMLEVAETINKEEKFLPKDWINRTDKLSKYKKAIFDRFGFDYSEFTIKNNFDKNLTDRHRLKVIKMLNEHGRMDLAKQYQIQYKCTA